MLTLLTPAELNILDSLLEWNHSRFNTPNSSVKIYVSLLPCLQDEYRWQRSTGDVVVTGFQHSQ